MGNDAQDDLNVADLVTRYSSNLEKRDALRRQCGDAGSTLSELAQELGRSPESVVVGENGIALKYNQRRGVEDVQIGGESLRELLAAYQATRAEHKRLSEALKRAGFGNLVKSGER